jgi:membrane-bound serine protease (ClpP class)
MLLAVLALFVGAVSAGAQDAAPPFVNHLVIEGTINPAVAEFVQESIGVSHREGARALVVQLDTPGGLLASTRVIVKAILGAPLPVIVYVAPSGASASSAGVFITLAAHVAAMAPGTTIGAAHPVGPGGQEVGGTMGEKLENFVASYGETIARQRGRNVEWAVRAVRESAAVTEVEALKLKVIDLVARDLDTLLQQVTGREVEIVGQKTSLALAGVEVRSIEMRLSHKVISFLADPNIAYFLLIVGILGLYLEFSNPGLLFPGITGAVCLLLALAAFQVLPINYAGLALVLLAMTLIVAEALVPGFGILGISGIISLVLGSLMLFDTAGERLVVERGIIVAAVAVVSSCLLVVGYLVFRAQRRRPMVGKEGLIGEVGRVVARVAPVGKVRVHGEVWTAESEETLEVGEEVRVSKVEDLHLTVQRA